MNLGSGGSRREGLGPEGATAEAAPLPPGRATGLGFGLGPAVATPVPGSGFTGGAVVGRPVDFLAWPRTGVVVDGAVLGTVVEGEVRAGTVVGVTINGVGVGGVGVDGTAPPGCVVGGADGVVVPTVEGDLVVTGLAPGPPVVGGELVGGLGLVVVGVAVGGAVVCVLAGAAVVDVVVVGGKVRGVVVVDDTVPRGRAGLVVGTGAVVDGAVLDSAVVGGAGAGGTVVGDALLGGLVEDVVGVPG